MVNNAMLPGALEGIKYFIVPKWERLQDFEVSKQEEGKHPSAVYGILRLAWVSTIVSVVSVNEDGHVF